MENPYYPPNQIPHEIRYEIGNNAVLASRLRRFFATLIDAILTIAITFILLIAILYTEKQLNIFGYDKIKPVFKWVTYGAIFISFFLCNIYLLASKGQTIGKKFLHLRIVTKEGRKPHLLLLVAIRYAPILIILAIPYMGIFLTILNISFIISEDRQCLHDLIAETRVVQISDPKNP